MLQAMSMAALQDLPEDGPDAQDMRVMAEAGVMAISAGRNSEARPIFEMIDAAQPQNAAGPICLALIQLSEGDVSGALARLRRATLERRHCRDEARAVLAILLIATGRKAEAAPLKRALLNGPPGAAKSLMAAYSAR